MLNKEHIIAIVQLFILLALFAYDGFTYLPEEMNIALLKGAYYVVIFGAFLFVVSLQTHKTTIYHTHLGIISYIIQFFIWIYLVRLYMDFIVNGVQLELIQNPWAALFLYINAAIIPFYGFYFFRWDLINWRNLNTCLLLVFLGMGLVSLYYIATGRALEYIYSDGRFMGNASMDTIAFGHLGTSITLLALALFHQPDSKVRHKILSIVSIPTGLFVSIAAGSRGAIVALIVCFVAYLYMNGHKMKILIGLPILTIVAIIALPYLNDILISFDNYALDRLYASIYDPNSMDDGVTTGRDVLYEKAWENFFANPIIGTSFFIDGKYVHNSIFESFIGLGFFGGCLCSCMLIYAFLSAFQIVRTSKHYMFLSLLCIQYITYSLLSRTLSLFPLFWLTIYIVIFIKNNESLSSEKTI